MKLHRPCSPSGVCSDVHVHTEAQLGRVTWSGAVSGQSKDVEIGRGRAALDVEVLVGTAQVTSD